MADLMRPLTSLPPGETNPRMHRRHSCWPNREPAPLLHVTQFMSGGMSMPSLDPAYNSDEDSDMHMQTANHRDPPPGV